MQLKLADGAELFYTIADFTDPWKEAEALVLVHGMAKTHRLWYAWVPILAAHYRVVRFDLRGHGQSTAAPPGYPLSLDGLANDLLQLADGLGLEKFHLIGETVGGTISMNFATLHQERLLSLALCTAPSHFTHPHRLQVAEEIEKEGVAAFVERTIAGRLAGC